MSNEQLKLTSSEIGTLWSSYVNGTMTDCVNRYMLSIIEDDSIKEVFEEAVTIFGKQKEQIVTLLKAEGFPIPQGFSDADINKNSKRLFSDIFCLQYLNIITIHGLTAHSTSLSVSARKDLRQMYDSFDNDGKKIFHKTTDLLLEKGQFQRDPLIFPEENIKFVNSSDFKGGLFKTKRPIAATEMISLSLNIKKNILAKTLSIAFSQVVEYTGNKKIFSRESANG